MSNDVRIRLALEGARGVVNGMNGVASSAEKLGGSMLTIGRAIAGLGAAMLAKEFVQVADAMALLEARLRTATGSAQAFAQAQTDIYKIAQANNIGLQETATLYTRLSDPVLKLGGTAREVSGIVDAFATSLRVGGASASEASAATLQFAQAMASGRLNGDEFRSIAEASPRFMRALADGIGVGAGELRKMSEEGKLTADVVGNALMSSLGQLKQEAQSMPDTVGGALKRFSNDVQLAVSDLNKIGGAGVTLGLAAMVEEVRKLIPAVRDELAGAFRATSEWVEKNREGLLDVWETTKSAVADFWEIAKAAGAVVGFVGQWAVQSGVLKGAFETIRLIFAGVQDGAEIIAATLATVGSRLLGVVGLFSAAAKGMAADAAAAAQVTFDKFGNGQSAVATLNTEMAATAARAAQAKAALAGAGVGAGELAREMRALAAHSDASAGPLLKLKGAAAELTAEQKKSADAAKKMIASGASLAADLLAQTGGLSPDFAEKWSKLMAAQKAGAITMGVLEKAQAALLSQQPAMVAQAKAEADALKDRTKAAEDGTKSHADLIAELDKSAATIGEQVQRLQDEEAAAALAAAQNITLAEAIARVEIARLREKQVAMMGNEDAVAAIEREIAARQQLAGALGRKESREAGDALRKRETEEWVKTWEQVGQGFVDNLMTGGKSAGQYIKDLFRTMVLRPMLRPVMGAMAGSLGLPGMASASGGGGGAGGLGSMMSSLSVLAGLGGAFKAGSALAMSGAGGTGLALEGAGAMLGSGSYAAGLAQGAGALAPWAAGAAAGVYGGRAISNGYAIGGGSGNGMVNLGTIAGAVLGGPIGAAIGGAIGGLVNRTFGRKTTEQGIQGTLGGSAGFQGSGYEFQKGGWFRSDRTVTSALDAGTTSAFSEAVGTMRTTTRDYAEALGLSAGSVDTFTQSIKLNLKGLSEAEQTKAIEGALSNFANGLATSLGAGLDRVALRGEAASDTLARLGGALTTVNGTLGLLGQAALAASVDGGAAADALLNAFGGASNFDSLTSGYFASFYSEAERTATQTGQMAKALGNLGLEMPATNAAFRALVEQQDLNTDAGRRSYAALMGLSGAFAELYPLTDKVSAAVEQVATAMETAGATVSDEIKRIRGLTATGGGKARTFAEAQSQFAITTAQARAGDAAAMAALPDASRALMDLADTAGSDRVALVALQSSVADSLQSTLDAAQPQQDAAPAATATADAAVALPTQPAGSSATAAQTSAQATADLLAELRALRVEVAALRVEQEATATNTDRMQRLLTRIAPNDALQTRILA